MQKVFFKTAEAFNQACLENEAKITTTFTDSGECLAGLVYSDLLLLVLSECDYYNAPFFDRGE